MTVTVGLWVYQKLGQRGELLHRTSEQQR